MIKIVLDGSAVDKLEKADLLEIEQSAEDIEISFEKIPDKDDWKMTINFVVGMSESDCGGSYYGHISTIVPESMVKRYMETAGWEVKL